MTSFLLNFHDYLTVGTVYFTLQGKDTLTPNLHPGQCCSNRVTLLKFSVTLKLTEAEIPLTSSLQGEMSEEQSRGFTREVYYVDRWQRPPYITVPTKSDLGVTSNRALLLKECV